MWRFRVRSLCSSPSPRPIQLEFRQLSHHTGDAKYKNAADKVRVCAGRAGRLPAVSLSPSCLPGPLFTITKGC
jgi:hypothetical protein